MTIPKNFISNTRKDSSLTFHQPLDWWSNNWDYFNNLEYKKIFYLNFIFILPVSFLKLVLLRSPLSDILGSCLENAVYVPIALLLFSFIFALPGLLFRKEFQPKPIFITALISCYIIFLLSALIQPLGYRTGQLNLFYVISRILECLVFLIYLPTLLLTWFTHDWKKGIQRASLGIGVLTFFVSLSMRHYRIEENIFAEKDLSVAKMMAGKTVSTSDFIKKTASNMENTN